MADQLVEIWRKIIVGDQKSWVLFKNGTCVILMEPEQDLAQQAITLLQHWGPVQAGTPAGDFSVSKLGNDPGWVVTGHHHDILTYVGPDEFTSETSSDLIVGLLGRQRRHEDATELEVIHVEDKRQPA
jgi:hypothetical protein